MWGETFLRVLETLFPNSHQCSLLLQEESLIALRNTFIKTEKKKKIKPGHLFFLVNSHKLSLPSFRFSLAFMQACFRMVRDKSFPFSFPDERQGCFAALFLPLLTASGETTNVGGGVTAWSQLGAGSRAVGEQEAVRSLLHPYKSIFHLSVTLK